MIRNIILATFIIMSTAILYGQTDQMSWREAYFQGEPLRIGNQVQFLFDDYVVEDKFGLKRVIGPVEKHPGNPLTFGEDMPWELASRNWDGVSLRNVLFDPIEKIYKGWYVIPHKFFPELETGITSNYSTLYAESKDGIIWEKPKLDFFLHNGEKTNMVLHREKGTAILVEIVLDTLAVNPEKRYMGLVKMVPPGEKIRCIVRMYSPDGKKWTLPSESIMFRGASDGSYSLIQDNGSKRWLLYRRPPTRAFVRGSEFYGKRNTKRRFSLSTSTDYKNWTYPRNIVLLDELDDLQVTQLGNYMDIDKVKVTKHKGVYLGFASLMDNLKIANPRHCQLIWSRDGLDWERLPERPNFIDNGEPGEWDARTIGGVSLIPAGDRYHLYYAGGNTTQSYYGREGEKNISEFSGTGLASVGKDRFVGLQAGPEGGYLLTRQFILDGDKIVINSRSDLQNPTPGLGSLMTAEILGIKSKHGSMKPYPGFSVEDCDPIEVNDEFQTVITWNGHDDLTSLKGKSVYIRFYIRNTTLYTFQVH